MCPPPQYLTIRKWKPFKLVHCCFLSDSVSTHTYLMVEQSSQKTSFFNEQCSGKDQRTFVRMSSRKSPTSSDKTVLDDTLTVDDVNWLTKHVLAELFQNQKPENEKRDKKKSKGGAVKAGVIRHTSSPNRPLAYYHIRK